MYVCHGNWTFCHMDTQSYKLFKFYTAHDRTKNVCHQLIILVWNNIQGNFLNGFEAKFLRFFRNMFLFLEQIKTCREKWFTVQRKSVYIWVTGVI